MRRLRVGLLDHLVSQIRTETYGDLIERVMAMERKEQLTDHELQLVDSLEKTINSDEPIRNLDARAFSRNIEFFERIDRMIMNAEARRNAALRELDRHRTSVALALRREPEEITEAEYHNVAPARRAQRI